MPPISRAAARLRQHLPMRHPLQKPASRTSPQRPPQRPLHRLTLPLHRHLLPHQHRLLHLRRRQADFVCHAIPAQMAVYRLAGDRAGGYYPGGPGLDGGSSGPDAFDPADGVASRQVAGLPYSRLWPLAGPCDFAGGRCHCQQFCRSQTGGMGRPAGQPHSGGALYLLQRQAGFRHLVFRKWQRVSHCCAGAVAARRGLDGGFITGSPAIEVACYLRDDYVSVFVPPPPTQPGVISCSCAKAIAWSWR